MVHQLYYILPLVAVTVSVGFLIYHGYAQKPTVTINFDIGEIIGGLLAGVGVLVAGVAYALRQLESE